jgi:hypothetical protein
MNIQDPLKNFMLRRISFTTAYLGMSPILFSYDFFTSSGNVKSEFLKSVQSADPGDEHLLPGMAAKRTGPGFPGGPVPAHDLHPCAHLICPAGINFSYD